jgi:hypothetical protein
MKCDIDFDGEGERPEFCKIEECRAIKPYKCGECNRVIEKGEIYERFLGIYFDRNTFYEKTCNDCVVTRKVFYGNGGFNYGEVFYGIREHYNGLDKVPESCLTQLTPRGREFFFDKIEKDWAEEEWEDE